jgi:hypothetical protein
MGLGRTIDRAVVATVIAGSKASAIDEVPEKNWIAATGKKDNYEKARHNESLNQSAEKGRSASGSDSPSARPEIKMETQQKE